MIMRLFSLFALKLQHSRWLLRSHGLQSHVIQLDNGCTIHCWASSASTSLNEPSCSCPPFAQHHNSSENLQSSDVQHLRSKPALLLLHGFGADGTMAWDNQVPDLSKHFSLYLPDLLFFGNSTITDRLDASLDTHTPHTRPPDQVKEVVRYSEIFQAECMHEAMQKMGVQEAVVLGHSYGGFVAYSMAHLYPRFVKELVILSSGVMMNPRSNDILLTKAGARHVHELLVPTTLPMFIRSLQLVFNDFLPSWLPSFLYKDMFESLGGDQKRRLQLVDDIILGKEDAPPLPSIEQSTLIFWGEDDQIFDIKLAHQLKEFLGARAKLSTMKGVGHMPHMVKPKEFNGLLLSSLVPSLQNNCTSL